MTRPWKNPLSASCISHACVTYRAMSKRDREATERALIEAVGDVMARQGLGGLNAEAVARSAGVNKALVYRYFGSLDGLVERFARGNTFWPSAEEIIGGDWAAFLALPRSRQMAVAHRNLFFALRERPMTRQIMIWELIEDSPFVEALEREREQVAQQIFSRMGEDRANPDMLAAAALFSGGVIYLLLRSRRTREFNSVDLGSLAEWERLIESIRKLAGFLV